MAQLSAEVDFSGGYDTAAAQYFAVAIAAPADRRCNVPLGATLDGEVSSGQVSDGFVFDLVGDGNITAHACFGVPYLFMSCPLFPFCLIACSVGLAKA